mmetsp:Transcript_27419/g.35944  ORF Transcript_27419/g.35944 Transcript_27419/m.35944 type:complete len:194 (-) Transcript_27419:144-725(-)
MDSFVHGPSLQRSPRNKSKRANYFHGHGSNKKDKNGSSQKLIYNFNVQNIKDGKQNKENDQSYWDLRNEKLKSQSLESKTDIFKGKVLFFNGRTGEISAFHLMNMVQRNGGRVSSHFSPTFVTHIIAENLSASKIQKMLKSKCRTKIVKPDWITESLAAQRLLPDSEFQLYASNQKKTLIDMFSSSRPSNKNR